MTKKLAWTDKAWNDYIYWQSQDKKKLKPNKMKILTFQ